MSENVDRVDHSRVKAVKFIHQLVFEMDRPLKVCIVSEAEVLPSSLGFLRDETLMGGQPNTSSPHTKGGFLCIIIQELMFQSNH
jgi:hypothetical protein